MRGDGVPQRGLDGRILGSLAHASGKGAQGLQRATGLVAGLAPRLMVGGGVEGEGRLVLRAPQQREDRPNRGGVFGIGRRHLVRNPFGGWR